MMGGGEKSATAMNSSATSRSAFLDKASLLLATASPAVSAELRSCLESDSTDKPPATRSGHCTCKSCGTILLPGWNSSFVSATTGPRSRQDRLPKTATTKSMSIQCSMCNAVTTVESPKPAQEKHHRATLDKPRNVTGMKSQDVGKEKRAITTSNAAAPETVDPASRKRSRNNKKSSLQSMLADRKSSEKPKASGLDIMDFMKT